MNVTQKALWYIESHLNSELSLEAVAEAANVSRFHLSRAFANTVGNSLGGYMRARRLSQAAKVLADGATDILSVALDAGYGSHEAFTRAFRQHFGCTPEHLRATAHTQQITLQEPIRMDQAIDTRLAPPRLIARDSLLMFGLSRRCPACGDPGIPAQWRSFVPHLGHIRNQVGHVAYGVIYNSDDSTNYDYMCAVEVREFPTHPEEFTRLRIPPQRYAVFEHQAHVSAVTNTWKAIWEYGLANAGLKAMDGPSFELYDERFDGRTGLGGLEIWVPVA